MSVKQVSRFWSEGYLLRSTPFQTLGIFKFFLSYLKVFLNRKRCFQNTNLDEAFELLKVLSDNNQLLIS